MVGNVSPIQPGTGTSDPPQAILPRHGRKPGRSGARAAGGAVRCAPRVSCRSASLGDQQQPQRCGEPDAGESGEWRDVVKGDGAGGGGWRGTSCTGGRGRGGMGRPWEENGVERNACPGRGTAGTLSAVTSCVMLPRRPSSWLMVARRGCRGWQVRGWTVPASF